MSLNTARPRTVGSSRQPNEFGQALVEYMLAVALVAVLVIGAALFLGSRTSGTLSDVGNRMQAVPGVELNATTPPSEYATKKTCKAAGYTWVAKVKKVPAHCSD